MIQNLIFKIIFLKKFFGHTVFLNSSTRFSEHHQSFFKFRFFSRESQSQQNLPKKDHSFYNTVLLKKPQSLYEPQLT